MRRSASEVIRNLEQRIARLERQSSNVGLDRDIVSQLSSMGFDHRNIKIVDSKEHKRGGTCHLVVGKRSDKIAIVLEKNRRQTILDTFENLRTAKATFQHMTKKETGGFGETSGFGRMMLARLERQAKKEPQWITWALEVLVESRETKAKSRDDLEERRNGQVWEYYQGRDDVIMVSSDADRSDYIIYENDDTKIALNNEIMENILENKSLKEIIRDMPWTKDILLNTLSLRYGDIEMWSSEWAERTVEDLDDDELIERAGMEDEKEEYEEQRDYYEKRMNPEVDGKFNPLYSDNAEIMVFDYNNMLNDLPESARSQLVADAEAEINKALKQYPYEYLTEEMGWSESQVLDAFGDPDKDEIESIIDQLGASEREFQYLAPSGKRLRTKLNYVIEEM